MPASQYAITIEEGATFVLTFTVKAGGVAVNLTGYTAQMQVRSTVESSAVIVEASSANNRVDIQGGTGVVTVTIPANVTSTLDFTDGVYDLKATAPGGAVSRYLAGEVTFSRAVTR